MANLIIEGIAASRGVAIGKAFILKNVALEITRKSIKDISAEIERFHHGILQSLGELKDLHEKVKSKMGEDKAQIFDAHMLILKDPELTGAVEKKIRDESMNAEAAFQEVTAHYVGMFESMENEYMRERAADIRDVSQRVINHLLGVINNALENFDEQIILIAHDLTPSDTAQLDLDYVAGFATNIGGRTSHSAIMARSMEIPAVVGLKDIISHVHEGSLIILDGIDGKVILEPTTEEVAAYREIQKQYTEEQTELAIYTNQLSVTADGHQVELAANIGTPDDLEGVLRNGAEGIGLFRSEFLYLNRNNLPNEEEQFNAYRQVAEGMKGKPVIIRTLDIGGDKELPYLQLEKELNPFLGYRAIRISLDRTDIFKTQLRAILRASHYGKVKIMYPMISTLTEIRQANILLNEVREELKELNVPFDPQIEVGIMIEIPAAAISADLFAKEIDFFSIGTNDLIQYTLASDRMNEKTSYLYQPYHPSVLRLINMVIQAGHQRGKWVGMCGEMASDPIAVPILLGLGLDEFSMSASAILTTRKAIKQYRMDNMREIAEQALLFETHEQVKEYVTKQLEKLSLV